MHSSEDNKTLSKAEYISILIEALSTIHSIKEERRQNKGVSHGKNFFTDLKQKRKQDTQTSDFYDEALADIKTLKTQGLADYQNALDAILQSNGYKIYQQTATEAPFVITQQDKDEELARLASEKNTPNIGESSADVDTRKSSASTLHHTIEVQKEVNTPVSSTEVIPGFFTGPKENTSSENKQQETDAVITQEALKEKPHPQKTSSDENKHTPIENSIDWNLCFRILSSIAATAGGAMLVVGLLLPLPGLAIAGACLLGIGVIGYSAASHPAPENGEEGVSRLANT